MSLNSRQQKFVDSYVKLGNATQSAVVAGYSRKTAAQAGHRLLRNSEILGELEKTKGVATKEQQGPLREILTELVRIAYCSSAPYSARIKALRTLLVFIGKGGCCEDFPDIEKVREEANSLNFILSR